MGACESHAQGLAVLPQGHDPWVAGAQEGQTVAVLRAAVVSVQ